MSLTIGTVWRRARLTLGLAEQELADRLQVARLDIALAQDGDIGACRKLNSRFTGLTGVDLYVLYFCLADPLAEYQPHAAALAEALANRLRQLGQENRRPADWSEVRRQVAGMSGPEK